MTSLSKNTFAKKLTLAVSITLKTPLGTSLSSFLHNDPTMKLGFSSFI